MKADCISKKCIQIKVDTSELDDVLKKVEKLSEALLEANALLDELASKVTWKTINIPVEIDAKAVSEATRDRAQEALTSCRSSSRRGSR